MIIEEARYGLSTLYDGWQKIPKRPRLWMSFLPKRARHLVLCQWKGKYENYCLGHGPERIKYLKSTSSV